MCLLVLAQGDQTLMDPTKSINPCVGGLDDRKMALRKILKFQFYSHDKPFKFWHNGISLFS